jgi:glycosyltransferase involved in cell wall biosynthesis
MEAKVASLGLSERVVFLGFRRDAPELVQAFDVVAVPSRVEPFGLASLEAMAAGRAVVASRVGGIPEVVRDEREGILVPAENPHALASGIARLLANPAERAAMGDRGRERAAQVFGMRVHGQAVHDVYEQLLSRKRSVRSGLVA